MSRVITEAIDTDRSELLDEDPGRLPLDHQFRHGPRALG